jgi:hypothetical protein
VTRNAGIASTDDVVRRAVGEGVGLGVVGLAFGVGVLLGVGVVVGVVVGAGSDPLGVPGVPAEADGVPARSPATSEQPTSTPVSSATATHRLTMPGN